MFYVDDLEFSASTPFTISARSTPRQSLYRTSNLTVKTIRLRGAPSIVEYGGSYVNGYRP